MSHNLSFHFARLKAQIYAD